MSTPGSGNLGEAYSAINAGQFDEAMQIADQVLATNPAVADAHLVRGVALSRLGRGPEAIDAMERSVTLAPGNTGAYVQLAWQLDQMGRKPEAIQRAQQAMQIDPNNVEAQKLLQAWQPQAPPSAPPSGYASAPGPRTEGPPQQGSPYVRPGYSHPRGGIDFVHKMGDSKWLAIFWVMWVLTLIVFVPYVLVYVGVFQEAFTAGLQGRQAPQSGVGILTILGLLLMPLVTGQIIWAIMDIVHRKGNWFWLAAFLCCNPILTWLYPVLGRKQQPY